MSEEPEPVSVPDDDEDDIPEPGAPPPAEPGPAEEEPAEEEPAEVEALLGFDEFVMSHAPFASSSTSVHAAVQAALRRWMQLHGKDPNGHYAQAEWAGMYDEMMAHS